MENKNLSWRDLEKEIFTPEEIAASLARVQIISAIIDAQKEKELSPSKEK